MCYEETEEGTADSDVGIDAMQTCVLCTFQYTVDAESGNTEDNPWRISAQNISWILLQAGHTFIIIVTGSLFPVTVLYTLLFPSKIIVFLLSLALSSYRGFIYIL